MMPGTYRNTQFVEYGSHIVRVYAFNIKRNDRCFIWNIPVNTQTINALQFRCSILEQLVLVLCNLIEAYRIHIV